MSIFSGCLGLPGVSSQGMIWATCQNRGTLKMRGFILGFSLSQPPRGCSHPSNADCPTKMESFSPHGNPLSGKTTRSTPPCPFCKQVAFSRRVKPSPGLLQICAERRVSNEGRVSIEGWGGVQTAAYQTWPIQFSRQISRIFWFSVLLNQQQV